MRTLSGSSCRAALARTVCCTCGPSRLRAAPSWASPSCAWLCASSTRRSSALAQPPTASFARPTVSYLLAMTVVVLELELPWEQNNPLLLDRLLGLPPIWL